MKETELDRTDLIILGLLYIKHSLGYPAKSFLTRSFFFIYQAELNLNSTVIRKSLNDLATRKFIELGPEDIFPTKKGITFFENQENKTKWINEYMVFKQDSSIRERVIQSETTLNFLRQENENKFNQLHGRLDELRAVTQNNAQSITRIDTRLIEFNKGLSKVEERIKSIVTKEEYEELRKEIIDMHKTVDRIASDYMPKSFWYTVVYPIIVATLPAVIVGLIFFFLTIILRPLG